MAYQIKVVIPAGAEADGTATLEDIREHVNERMAELCGGFTTYRDCRGGWVSDDGDLVTEDVFVHTCVGEFHTEIGARAVARELAKIVQFSTDEDATLFTVTETYMDLVE